MSETKHTVQEAWAAVMADVSGLGKHQRNTAPGQNFNFRGVDDVMNAVGPVLRTHGVSVIPTAVEAHHRDAQTTTGKASREATVVVTYTIYGPAGDSMPGASVGESLDSGDKATPKAMSVAYRTFLLQALCLPTNEPDPDSQSYERVPEPTPADLVAQVVSAVQLAEDEATVREWGNRAHSKGLLDHPVAGTGTGAETLGALITQRLATLADATQAGAA